MNHKYLSNHVLEKSARLESTFYIVVINYKNFDSVNTVTAVCMNQLGEIIAESLYYSNAHSLHTDGKLCVNHKGHIQHKNYYHLLTRIFKKPQTSLQKRFYTINHKQLHSYSIILALCTNSCLYNNWSLVVSLCNGSQIYWLTPIIGIDLYPLLGHASALSVVVAWCFRHRCGSSLRGQFSHHACQSCSSVAQLVVAAAAGGTQKEAERVLVWRSKQKSIVHGR